jgi:hypothetical protein
MNQNKYYSDIFYSFNLDVFLDIIRWGVENAYSVKVQVLNSSRRVDTDLTIDQYLEIREESKFKHDVVIYRRGHPDWKNNEFFNTSWCIEIGSCTDKHFLFIYVKEDKLQELINKFNLIVLN